MRPVLKPALRRLWRGDRVLQIGADPVHAVVLDGIGDGAAAVLASMDGTRDAGEVVAQSAAAGMRAEGVRELIDLLADVGALDDAGSAPHGLAVPERERLEPDLATLTLMAREPGAGARWLDTRRSSSVLVVGAGRVGSLVASLLAAAGVGQVAVRDELHATAGDAVPGGTSPADTGQPRAIATACAAQRAGAAAVEGAVRAPDSDDCHAATIAVVVPDGWLVPDQALVELFGVIGLPYLVAGVRETYGVVGPLVIPGRTSCPRCHDLYRAERDPAWPTIVSQLAAGSRGVEPACDVTLAAAVASVAAGQVLAYLVSPRLTRTVNATLEIRVPDWTMRRRRWTPHAGCVCNAAAATETATIAARVATVEAALDARAAAAKASFDDRTAVGTA